MKIETAKDRLARYRANAAKRGTASWRDVRESGPLCPAYPARLGAENDDGLRWCDSPAAFGFRFVGDGPELFRAIPRWYTDCYQQGTAWGAVYQLPARRGVVQLFAAVRTSDDGDGAQLYMRRPVGKLARGIRPDDHDYRDAAVYADGLAEDCAEKARDYDRAWQAGSQYASCSDQVRAACKALRSARRALKTYGDADVSAAGETIRLSLRNDITRLRIDLGQLIRECAELRNGDCEDFYFSPRDKEKVAAFNDGAGRAVLK